MKKIIIIIIAIFAVANIYAQDNTAQNKVKIDIMYFHATMRCEGCLSIEAGIKSIVSNKFSAQIKDSSYVLSSIDFLKNEKMAEKYKIETQSLIISKKVNGKEVKWVNLDKIWDYYGDYEKFQAYIEDAVNDLNKNT